MKGSINTLLKYFAFPIVIVALSSFFPALYDRNFTILMFSISAVLGILVLTKGSMDFLSRGNLKNYISSLSFFLLSIFSLFSALGFFINNITIIGWIVQTGTLLTAAMFLALTFLPERHVSKRKRFSNAFTYAIYAFLASAFVILTIISISDNLPSVYSQEVGWGKYIFEIRLATAIVFLLAALRLMTTTGTAYEYIAGPAFLLSAGSFGVAALFYMNIASNSIVTMNRVLTVIALLVFLIGLRKTLPLNNSDTSK